MIFIFCNGNGSISSSLKDKDKQMKIIKLSLFAREITRISHTDFRPATYISVVKPATSAYLFSKSRTTNSNAEGVVSRERGISGRTLAFECCGSLRGRGGIQSKMEFEKVYVHLCSSIECNEKIVLLHQETINGATGAVIYEVEVLIIWYWQ